ncbi:MAG: DUF4234 domain-containing protein [Clostridia bacterium]|nr:DUF4234 domain-containing protein [Clostridia bacterium]
MPYPYSYDEEAREYKPPKLVTNRNVWKLILFNILTLGIYNIIFFMPLSYDLDKVSPKRDRSRTMNFLVAYIISLFTFSIVLYIWHYMVAKRVEEALEARDIRYEFRTGDFWGWYLLGSFILIGPYVYWHKLCKAMNLLCADYNERPSID